MRSPRHKRELDWQADLAARTAADGKQPARASLWERVAGHRVRSTLWGMVTPVTTIVYMGAVIIGRHHPVGVVLIVLTVCLLPFQWAAARREKSHARDDSWVSGREWPPPVPLTIEERLEFKLSMLVPDLQWFLRTPVDRATYERWIKSTARRIGELSPEVADRWARPDPVRGPAGDVVSAAELNARRERLLELYAELAPRKSVSRVRADLPPAGGAAAGLASVAGPHRRRPADV